MTAIAIVGMGCRFAGAEDLQAYWRMIREGRHAFGPVPEDRWPAEVFFDTNRRATDKTYAPSGAFLQDIKTFPALALGLPPRRVEVMDPQQRLTLETSLQAIEDGGYHARDLPERTGVYVGITAQEYRALMGTRIAAVLLASGHVGRGMDDPEALASLAEAVENVVPSRPYSAPGSLGNMSAAIVAQELDLHGPAYTTDAACASAHMAVYDAVQQLRTGAIDAALAGGSYIQIMPDHYVAFARIGAMSAAGVCRPFDHRADGFVQGDGAGMLLLKRLEDAERDGDRIYGVIHGVGINNDGRGDGPMAPDEVGQTAVIDRAWEDAGLDKASLGYMEAHGTGTSVGDPTEIRGLTAAVGDHVRERVALGSSKANVGHTMSAAGIAGLIRATLAVHHGVIPPMANFEKARDELELHERPFDIPTEARAWQADTRVAGCSAFGFGGTNGHVIVAEHTGTRKARAVAVSRAEQAPPQAELVLLSAPSEALLRDLAGRVAETVQDQPDATVAGVARAWSGRAPQRWRLGVVARTPAELVDKLGEVADGGFPSGVKLGEAQGIDAPRVAFLFPGQGAQRIGMLRGARARFDVVRETLDALEQDLEGLLPVPLTHLIYPELRDDPVDDDTAAAQLTDTAHTQPAMFAVGVALARLLERVGVDPHVVVGHSLGEFTAATVAGVMTPGEGARFVAQRGTAMAGLSGDHGTMAAVMADRETVEELLVDGAIIANVNHPRQLVVSGFTEAVEQVVANARAAEIKAVPLSVSHGFHSPALADLDSAPLLDGIELQAPRVTVASGITDHVYADAADARDVFLRHATSPVEFVRALEQCREAGADLYLQVGAGGPLAAFARGSLPRDHRGILTLTGRKDDDAGTGVLEGLAELWTRGVDLDVTAITAPAVLPSLPPTVLPREPYWAVKSETQLAVELKGVTARPRPQGSQVTAPAPAVEAAPADDGRDPIELRVLQVIGKVSAYPLSALRLEMTLVDDLGFDSLMVGDLATGLADAFPGIDGIPQELLINGPTVRDIVDFARNAGEGGGATVHDDDAPLQAYAVGWVEAEVPDLPGRDVPEGLRVLLVDAPEAVGAAFAEAGATVTRTTAADAALAASTDLVVWGALTEHPPVSAVLAREIDAPDPAAPLIAALAAQAKQGAHPDVIALTHDGDAWAGAVHGVIRGLPREWPGASATSLHLDADALDAPGDLVLSAWTSADRTSDVRHADGTRQIPAYTVTAADDAWTPSADDTVLITGGTRGIGLSLARRLVEAGARVVLVGRSAPGPEARALLDSAGDRAVAVQADVTDGAGLGEAIAPHGPVTALVHAAGVLADGPLEQVDPARGALARRVKAEGLLHAVRAAGDSLQVAVGIGSWAGRFGNRHQAHYNAANALLASLTAALPIRAVCAEFGPWTSSDMASTIPAPVQAAMRAEGIDFVGDQAGLDALDAALRGHAGPVVLGRDLPATGRAARAVLQVSTQTHPYLLDHAIEGVPVLPLAGATDLMAWAAGATAPFEVDDVRLFQGITVTEPVTLTLIARGDRVEIRQGEREALAYKARVRPLAEPPEDPGAFEGGEAPDLPLATFYDDITFHGPLLQGLTAIDGLGEGFVRGRLRVGRPADWIPDTDREAWVVDPYALDSAMQLSGYVAWVRFQRAGTPVGIGSYVQIAPMPEQGELIVEVAFGAMEGDRFSGTLRLRDPDTGALIVLAEDVVAELRRADTDDATEADEVPFEVKPEWIDFSKWSEVQELETRLAMAQMAGIRNPYFRVQEGTARDTTVIEGKEYINFSSYNYIGLSGDDRVVADVKASVERYGTSVSASRVASGERPFHQQLEALLARSQRAEDALVFTAGHATNVTTIGHLFGPDDLIVHDEYIHDSGLQGIKLSGAKRRMFRHDDPEACEAELQRLRRHSKRCLILVEGVYSMDGDICKLPQYIELKRKYGCLLMVDEAHSFGIVGETGCGLAEHFDLAPDDVDIWMGTLSKSLASCGGWISGSKPLINYLRYTAPGFVYSAGLTAANGVAALRSLELMLEEPWRVQKLQHNAQFFQRELARRGVDTGPARGESGVIPAITGNSMWALQLAQRLNEAGINVQPIVYPAVPDDAARLRYFLSSTHSEAQLAKTAELTATILEQVKADFAMP